MNADAYFTNIVLRTKKYRKLITRIDVRIRPLLEGQLDVAADRAAAASRAPLFAASMIPGPAPVMIANPASASSRDVSCAASYCGSSGPVRAEPKIETPFSTSASVSKPSMNSHMMRSTRHGSVRVKSTREVGEPSSFSSSVTMSGRSSRIESSAGRSRWR